MKESISQVGGWGVIFIYDWIHSLNLALEDEEEMGWGREIVCQCYCSAATSSECTGSVACWCQPQPMPRYVPSPAGVAGGHRDLYELLLMSPSVHPCSSSCCSGAGCEMQMDKAWESKGMELFVVPAAALHKDSSKGLAALSSEHPLCSKHSCRLRIVHSGLWLALGWLWDAPHGAVQLLQQDAGFWRWARAPFELAAN